LIPEGKTEEILGGKKVEGIKTNLSETFPNLSSPSPLLPGKEDCLIKRKNGLNGIRDKNHYQLYSSLQHVLNRCESIQVFPIRHSSKSNQVNF